MNPRKTFLQMTTEERTAFLNEVSAEINRDNFNPIKKTILEKVIAYARESLVAPNSASKPNQNRYDICETIFQSRNMATLCFLEVVIESLEKIEDKESKLRASVLDDAAQRLAVLKETHKANLSGFSVGVVASSAVLFWYDWPAAILLALNGVLLNKYSDGIVDIRLAQALKEQKAALLLQNPNNILPIAGDFGDSIDHASIKTSSSIYGFFSQAKSTLVEMFEQGMNPRPRN